jgi:hypothetical protein
MKLTYDGLLDHALTQGHADTSVIMCEWVGCSKTFKRPDNLNCAMLLIPAQPAHASCHTEDTKRFTVLTQTRISAEDVCGTSAILMV